MNLTENDLQELMGIAKTDGCYFDLTLRNSIGVETLATYFHDLYGWHALVQIWDSREKKPFWRFVLLFGDGMRIKIVKTYDDPTLWHTGTVPYVDVAKIIVHWRQHDLP